MIRFIYNLTLSLLRTILLLVPLPLKSKKFQQWKTGQQTVWLNIQTMHQRPIWFHISSSGEFEQAKPLIEFLHTKGFKIIATFFSPSGYEELKNNKLFTNVYYLPIDTKKNAVQFLNKISPIAAVFVKYDFWLNYMTELNKRKTPTFVISGVFAKNHFMFSMFGKAHLRQLQQFEYISVQDKASFELLKKYGINSEVTGDTRIDRSIGLPEEIFTDHILEQFKKSAEFCIIIGSSWKKDLIHFEQIYKKLNQLGIKLIIAPHELDKEIITDIQQTFSATLYTDNKNVKQYNTLILNTIGILKYVYRYADLVYIGGGFNDGIHNTLEPASYSKPVIFGPNYKKFMEAVIMIEKKGAFSIQDSNELYSTITQLIQNKNFIQAGQNANQYLLEYKGATKKIGAKMIDVLNTIDR